MTDDDARGGESESPDGADPADGDGGDDHREHGHGHDHHHGHDVGELGVAVVTVSSTRDIDDDPAGDAVAETVEAADHEVAVRELVRDDYDGVQSAVNRLVDREDVDVVVTTGGTGVTPDDVTIEAVEPLFDKHLPGIGELFRQLSREEVGTRVVATRATGGLAHRVPVFCFPGSENAARLGAEELVVPEAAHLVGLAERAEQPEPDDELESEREMDDPGATGEGDGDGEGGEP